MIRKLTNMNRPRGRFRLTDAQSLEDRTLLAPDVLTSVWQHVDVIEHRDAALSFLQAGKFETFTLDEGLFQSVVDDAPLEFTGAPPANILLPDPTGNLQRFEFVNSPIMAPELAARYPTIQTFAGSGIDDPTATVRFNITAFGLHAQILSTNGAWYIDAYSSSETSIYASYFGVEVASDYSQIEFVEDIDLSLGDAPEAEHSEHDFTAMPESLDMAARSSGTQLRIYQTAIATTAEFTARHGGPTNVSSKVTNLLSDINGIYETELSIRLQLVPNNDQLYFTDTATDGYDNNIFNNLRDQNQLVINHHIGEGNYDVGHVLATHTSTTSARGRAKLRSVGQRGHAARGSTAIGPLDFSPQIARLLAHEFGHQFGATHTFNGDSGACAGAGQWTEESAVEPGSGSTIMSYASTCSDDDTVTGRDPYFHSKSFDQIISYVDRSIPGVGTRQDTFNAVPVVIVGADMTIPARTPFSLSSITPGSDGDADTLTYNWEQRDTGPQQDVKAPDNGESPLWRSWPPAADSTRVFPRLQDLVDNKTVIGEKYAETTRDMNFRLTVRDGRGGVNSDHIKLNVVDTGRPFRVTSPNTNVTWPLGSRQLVTWDVAGTNANGINADFVNILISIDGGLTYPTQAANWTPNDGSEWIQLPHWFTPTTTARIKVESFGLVPGPRFFDLSDVNFTLTTPADFGSAPDSYGTKSTSNGPAHPLRLAPRQVGPGIEAIFLGPFLGTNVGAQHDGIPTLRPEEEGITFPVPLTWNSTGEIEVTSSAGGGFLDYFFDFDGDGTFGGESEHFSAVLLGGTETLQFSIPSGPPDGELIKTYARFRISSTGGLGPLGLATDGEVEDYAITIGREHSFSFEIVDNETRPGLGNLDFPWANREARFILRRNNPNGVLAGTINYGYPVTHSGTLRVSEDGGTGRFEVYLNEPPTGNVVLSIQSGDADKLTVSPATLSFSAGNWNTPETVVVTGVDDGVCGQVVTSVDVSISGLGHSSSVRVEVVDDDCPQQASGGGDRWQSAIGVGALPEVSNNGFPIHPFSILTTGSFYFDDGESVIEGDVRLSTAAVHQDTIVEITASGAGFGTASDSILLRYLGPSEYTVNLPATIDEGQTAIGTIVRNHGGGDVDLSPTLGVHGDLVVPVRVSIPDGAMSADFPITVVDDVYAQGDRVEMIGFQEIRETVVVSETGTTDTFDVVLSVAPTSDVVLLISSADTGEAEVLPRSLTFTPTNWNTPQTVTVTGVDDGLRDGDQTTLVTVSVDDAQSDDAFDSVPDRVVPVTTLDDGGPAMARTELRGNTAISGSRATVTFDVVSNVAQNADVFVLVGGSVGALTVVDNDPLELTLLINPREISEDGIATATLIRNSPPNSPGIDVALQSSDVTAVTVPPIVQFPDGFEFIQFPVTAVDDALFDGTQTVTVTARANGYTDGVDTIDVLDDESSGPGDPELVITEIMYDPASAEDGWEWVEVYNQGATSVSLSGFVLDDDDNASHATANVLSGSIAAGGTAVFYNADAITAADFEAAWGTGVNLVPVRDWGNLRLDNTGDVVGIWQGLPYYRLDHWNHDFAVDSVPYGSDAPAVDGRSSIFLLDVTAQSDLGSYWAQSSVGWAGAYQSLPAGGNVGGEVASPGVVPMGNALALTIDTAAISENGETAFGEVLRSGMGSLSGNLVVTLASSDPSRLSVPSTISLVDGQAIGLFTMTAVDNSIPDGPQFVTITATVAGYTSGSGVIEVIDDEDPAGFTIMETGGNTVVSETGTTDTFDVVLNVAPTSDVVLLISSADTGEATVAPTSLTFTPTNWNTTQAVTVTGVDDVLADGEQTTLVTVSVDDANSDNAFDPVTDQLVNVTTLDDEVASDAPVVSGLSAVQLYREGRPPALLSPNAIVSDPDTPILVGGRLLISFLNGEAGDQVSIVMFRGVEAIGTDVRHNGVSVGTITSNVAGPGGGMTIDFNSNATLASVTAILNAVGFSNVQDDLASGVREVQYLVDDGTGGISVPVLQQIDVQAQSDRPHIANLGGPVTFVEDAGPIDLTSTGTLFDPDLHADWNGGRLNVRVSRNLDSFDRLTIRNDGNGPGQIGVSGNQVLYESVQIGTFNGGVGTTRLQINFIAGSTESAIQALIRAIQFENLIDLPIVASKDVRFELTDPENFANLAVPNGILIVNMEGTNDLPTIGGISSSPQIYNEGGAPRTVGTGGTVTDGDYNGTGFLRVSIVAGGEATDRLNVLNQGMGTNQVGVVSNQIFFSGVLIANKSGGIGVNPMQINFNANATRPAVQAVMRLVQFSSASENPSTMPRQLDFLFNDGAGADSNVVSAFVNVNATNDASVIANYGADVNTTIGTNVRVAQTVSITDVDSPDFAGGLFRATMTSGQQAGDTLSLFNDATISVVGSDVFYLGTNIGTQVTNATSLTVLLNANATATMVQRLGRNLEFSATSAGTRTIRYQVLDGDGGNSTGPGKNVNVS